MSPLCAPVVVPHAQFVTSALQETVFAIDEASQAETGTTPAAGTPSETVPLTAGGTSAAGPPETPRKQGEILARGAVQLGEPSPAKSAQGDLQNELLDKGLAPFQACFSAFERASSNLAMISCRGCLSG